MIASLPQSTGKVLGFQLTGKLHDSDYQHFMPIVEAAIEAHGKVRILAQFEDFRGWDLHALWDDTKFAAKHCADIERMALVGDRKWEEWMAKICRPFTEATLRYFEISEAEKAWLWLNGDADLKVLTP